MLKRILWPFLISLFLLLVYADLRFTGIPPSGEPVQHYLLAVALVALSVALVRAAGFVLFDIIFVKRNKRPAPALLRALFSIAVYPPLLLSSTAPFFSRA